MNVLVRATEAGPVIEHANEHELQEGMAELARLYGWRAEREVVIPGWGRLDLVLHSTDADDYAAVIEFKTELVRANKIRRAFQQADGYHRWLASHVGIAKPVILAATDITEHLVDLVAEEYYDTVTVMYSSQVLRFITGDYAIERRVGRAIERRDAIAAQFALAEQAVQFMTEGEA